LGAYPVVIENRKHQTRRQLEDDETLLVHDLGALHEVGKCTSVSGKHRAIGESTDDVFKICHQDWCKSNGK
jgi:hypothetical protein